MVSWIFGKRAENSKIWDFWGSFAAAKRPLAAVKGFAAAKDSEAEKEDFPSSGSPRRS